MYKGLHIEKELDYGIVILKLKHDYFHIEKDIFICFTYIPHEKSNFYQICEYDFHDTIEGIILEYSEKV